MVCSAVAAASPLGVPVLKMLSLAILVPTVVVVVVGGWGVGGGGGGTACCCSCCCAGRREEGQLVVVVGEIEEERMWGFFVVVVAAASSSFVGGSDVCTVGVDIVLIECVGCDVHWGMNAGQRKGTRGNIMRCGWEGQLQDARFLNDFRAYGRRQKPPPTASRS